MDRIGSSIGTVVRSIETLMERAPSGISYVDQLRLDLLSTFEVLGADACPTRSMLHREYGKRINSRLVAHASLDVTCATRCATGRAVRGSQLPSTTPARVAMGCARDSSEGDR
jgi:hypothetical protein